MSTVPTITDAQLAALQWLPDDGSFRPRMPMDARGRRSITSRAPAPMTLFALLRQGLADGDQVTDSWAITPLGRAARDIWTRRRNSTRQIDLEELLPAECRGRLRS